MARPQPPTRPRACSDPPSTTRGPGPYRCGTGLHSRPPPLGASLAAAGPPLPAPPHSSLLLLQQRLRMLDSGSRHLRASTTRLPATPPRTNSPWLRFSAQCPYSRRRITSGTSPQMLLLTCLPVPISSHIFLPHGILLLSLLLSVTDPCSPL